MAQRLQLVDDIDGTDAAETIAFSLDGVNYEIDLNEEHCAELRASLEKWVEHGRRVGGRRAAGKPTTSSGISATVIRDWAMRNGLEVNARGRVSAEVREAYEKAHR